MNQPQAEFLDLYRSGLKNAADLMKASLESAERLQNQQLSAIRSALEQQSKAMSELTEARSFDQLISVQQQMAGANFERVMGYWSNLCQVAGQNQMAAIGQVQQQMSRISESLAQAVTATAGSPKQPQQPERKQPRA